MWFPEVELGFLDTVDENFTFKATFPVGLSEQLLEAVQRDVMEGDTQKQKGLYKTIDHHR